MSSRRSERVLVGEPPVYSLANRVGSALLVAVLLVGFIWVSISRSGVQINLHTVWEYRQRFAQGFLMTLLLSIGAMAGSLIIGVLVAWGRRSRVLLIRYLASTYVEGVRGTPLLVQIYFFYYLIGTAWGLDNRYLAGLVILSIFEGAYVAEIIRGAWQSIDRQTFEVARAVGLDGWKTFRLVTFPILQSRAVPALAGQAASVIKDSSLLSVIAVIELTQTTQEVSAENFQLFANYLLLGCLYLALTFPVSVAARFLERRTARAFGTE